MPRLVHVRALTAGRLARLGLLARFSTLSVIAFLVIGVVVARMLEGQIRHRALDDAAGSAALVARFGIQPQLSSTDLERGLAPEAVASIDQLLAAGYSGGELRSLTVFNADGRIVYATEHRLIGRRWALSAADARRMVTTTSAHVVDGAIVGDVPLILDAIALASVATGAPVMVHTNAAFKTGLTALSELTSRGVDPTRIVIAHAGDSNDMDYLREIGDSGAVLGLDRFNIPSFNSDEHRIDTLCKLLDEGYIDRIHLAHDAASFNDFMQHNPPFAEANPNYTHIHYNVLPKLRERGVTEEQIDEMLVTNARRFLAPDDV